MEKNHNSLSWDFLVRSIPAFRHWRWIINCFNLPIGCFQGWQCFDLLSKEKWTEALFLIYKVSPPSCLLPGILFVDKIAGIVWAMLLVLPFLKAGHFPFRPFSIWCWGGGVLKDKRKLWRKNFLPQFCLKTSVGGSASESRGIVQIQASENIGIRKFFSKCLRIFKKLAWSHK